jgi:hypothetical protein
MIISVLWIAFVEFLYGEDLYRAAELNEWPHELAMLPGIAVAAVPAAAGAPRPFRARCRARMGVALG